MAQDPDVTPEAPALPDTHEGDGLLWASWVGTAALAITAVPAVVSPTDLVTPYVLVSMTMFFVGIVVFLVAYVRAVGRSRVDSISVAGLFFGSGSAPVRVRWHLMGSFATQVVVGFGAAAVHVYTPTAFGILAPMYGIAVAGMWGARHGVFEPRAAPTGQP